MKTEPIIKNLPRLEQQLQEQMALNIGETSDTFDIDTTVELTSYPGWSDVEALDIDGLDDVENDINDIGTDIEDKAFRKSTTLPSGGPQDALESPLITGEVDEERVKEAVFEGSDFTSRELEVVADLANALRPFTLRRRLSTDPNTSKTQDPLPHIDLRAPFVLIANAILRAAGYSKFCRRVTIAIALVGASVHFNADNTTLPPFSQSIPNNANQQQGTCSQPRTSMRDAIEAPFGKKRF
ncbi:hypothetical protein BGX26_001354 [Mortierella sp. AD094]|nr:hypothetical protein BGX26_001354 [Mortierella sp. AD094]